MIPELGQVALILALQLALAQAVLGIAGAARADAAWMAMARGAARGQALFVAGGFAALLWAFHANDFSVLNVAEHSSRHLPAAYRLTAAWGSHEGSMLLWALILGGWSLAVVALSGRLPVEVAARVVGVMGLVSSGFLAFILFTSNPFLRLDPPPPDGQDLNPLLQDPGMILHPPLLYMGYVGFSVAFAFAVAALLSGRMDATWARWARPWTLVAWLFLTLGIMVGSWWAYYELGWGGWWFWDPTENASLMPWLVGTALLHSLAATDRRDCFRVWTVFLAIGAFSLSLLGTFLVRSGVLTSVHAFAQDPTRGMFILGFIALVVGGSLLLFAERAREVKAERPVPTVSREAAILAGNVLLLVVAATVLLGTLYPLLLDALGVGKVSVGPPYFNTVFVPLMAPVLLLLGLAPRLSWGGEGQAGLPAHFRGPLILALAAAFGLPLLAGEFRWQAAIGLGLATWIALTTGSGLAALWRQRGRLPLSALGMGLAHFGVALGIVGIGMVSAYEREVNVAMKPGDTTALAGYVLTYDGHREEPGPNYSAVRGLLRVSGNGLQDLRLEPEKRVYHASQMPMTESAIRYGLTGDLYVSMGEPLPGGAWAMRIYLKPFIGWIWVGALLLALGALLAAIDRRYRRTAE
jgi:cytochrome c-type biogenesis protein CcmF